MSFDNRIYLLTEKTIGNVKSAMEHLDLDVIDAGRATDIIRDYLKEYDNQYWELVDGEKRDRE